MFINKLYVRNFRGFGDDCEFHFDSNLSVICGVNGSGKTSVLEALCVALGGWLAGFDMVKAPDKRTIKTADIRKINESINGALLPQVPVEVGCEAEVFNEHYSWERIRRYISSSHTYNNMNGFTALVSDYNKRLFAGNDKDIYLPVLAYYSAARLWNIPLRSSKSFKKPKHRIEGYKGALAFSNSNNDAMAAIDRIAFRAYRENNYYDNQLLQLFTDAIQKSLASVMPDATVYYDIDLAEICVKDNDTIYMYSNLSDGYRCVISMILDICRRIIELNPQWGVAQNVDILKLASGVVLIDEIELHLHPKWQQQVLNDLIEIFPQIQFIVTTHSPSIINSVEKKQLLLLVDNSVYYPEGTYGKDVNSILENIMGVPSRPEQIENEIRYIYQLIDDSKYEDATLAFEKLRHIIGHDDSEIISLGITIDLESPEEE